MGYFHSHQTKLVHPGNVSEHEWTVCRVCTGGNRRWPGYALQHCTSIYNIYVTSSLSGSLSEATQARPFCRSALSGSRINSLESTMIGNMNKAHTGTMPWVQYCRFLQRPVHREVQEVTDLSQTKGDRMHQDRSQSRLKQDVKDIQTVLDYLEERKPFIQSNKELRSLLLGLTVMELEKYLQWQSTKICMSQHQCS